MSAERVDMVTARNPEGYTNRMSLLVWSLLTVGFASPYAAAATARADFGVTASVQASCSISTVIKMLSTRTQSAATPVSMVTVTCTNTTPYSVGFSQRVSSIAPARLEQLNQSIASESESTSSPDSVPGRNSTGRRGSAALPGVETGSAQPIKSSGASSSKQFDVPALSCDTVTATITY